MITSTFSFAHISDLHFSHGTSEHGTHEHSIPYLKQVESILKNKEFDRVIVSGDLTNRGDRESLLLVKNWLHGEFPISGTEKAGLRLSADVVRVVPGNHDAYNCNNHYGSYLECWQKSVKNFMDIFPVERVQNGCRYEWLEKGDHAVYIVYVDSCFLGDPSIEHFPDILETAISRIDKIARGKLTEAQSQQLVSWFDTGMQGNLVNPTNTNEKISKETFAKSFKIVVMHHYLFEPIGYKEDFFLSVQDRQTVFRNFVLADFDMCLCGHKHVPEFRKLFYGDHFDKRARGKYLLELFRRTIGIRMMPFKFVNRKGLQMQQWFTQLLQVLYVKAKTDSGDDLSTEEYVTKLLEMLAACLERPAQALPEIAAFVRNFKPKGYELISADSMNEIQIKVTSGLTKNERELLAEFADVYLKKTIKTMNQRPFIQSMAGSATKRSTQQEKKRGLSIYSISMDDSSVVVLQQKYTLDPSVQGRPSVTEQKHIFHNHCTLNCKHVTD